MEFNYEVNSGDQPVGKDHMKEPEAYQINGEKNEEEKDLQRINLFGSSSKKSPDDTGMEGKGMGGENFGRNNITEAGNDNANPSQMAGDNNAYFNRTQPAEEHPEYNNFKAPAQAGEADYGKALHGEQGEKQGESSKSGETDNEKSDPEQTYEEGTADEDGDLSGEQKNNIPGPNEVPDQQKVGE